MNASFSRMIYTAIQFARREPVLKALGDLEKSEFFSAEQLEELKRKRFLELLHHAVKNVPFYREKYKVHRSAIEKVSLADLPQLTQDLPIVTKEDVIEYRDRFFSSKYKIGEAYVDRTSGSTGTPLRFPCDKRAWAYRHALSFRFRQSFGVKLGEPYIYFYGSPLKSNQKVPYWFRDHIFNRQRISANEICRDNFQKQLLEVQKKQPTHFVGYPSAIYEFCLLLKEEGLDLKKLGLKAVFVEAEPLLASQKTLIQEITASPCAQIYGSAEGGLSAFECPKGSLHVASETTWMEPRDPQQDSSEILVTDMMLRSFPMIRYAIGDEVDWSSRGCYCGRAHPVLGGVRGRVGEALVLASGKRVDSHALGYLFHGLEEPGLVRRYRFVETADSKLVLYLVTGKKFTPRHQENLCKQSLELFGKEIQLSICKVKELPVLANAKHRRYVRLLKKAHPERQV